jgi:hypothetical protein
VTLTTWHPLSAKIGANFPPSGIVVGIVRLRTQAMEFLRLAGTQPRSQPFTMQYRLQQPLNTETGPTVYKCIDMQRTLTKKFPKELTLDTTWTA